MEMRKVVKACDDDIIESKKKRTHIKEKYADIPSKRKKWLKKINKEIEQQEKVKATFKATMMQYTDKLAKLNSTKSNVEKELDYGDGDDDSSNSSGSDGSSDSEDSK
jgi:seryl-tRNA synthetase